MLWDMIRAMLFCEIVIGISSLMNEVNFISVRRRLPCAKRRAWLLSVRGPRAR